MMNHRVKNDLQIDKDTSLTLDDGQKLQLLAKDAKLYMHKTILLFGASNSGKTTILDEIMYLCRTQIPVIFVISATDKQTGAFTGKVPPRCIMKTMDFGWLEDFVTRQLNVTEIVKSTNSIKILVGIFKKVASVHEARVVNTIMKRAQELITSISIDSEMNYGMKKAQKRAIERDRDNTLIKILKATIRHNKLRLNIMPDLTAQEKAVVEYLDVNPNAIFILDDCASEFKKWHKQTTLLKKIFYEGRHMSLTVIITAQDDKEIDSELRKNSAVTIFTTAQAATANFERFSNNYSKCDKEMAKNAIKAVFKSPADGKPPHHQKLCYIRGDQDPFRYTIADIYDDFKFGCDALWELNKQFKDTEQINHSNPFLSRFV